MDTQTHACMRPTKEKCRGAHENARLSGYFTFIVCKSTQKQIPKFDSSSCDYELFRVKCNF